MNYSQIYYNDIANGPGFRTDLFVSGCTHHCKGCFNECTWDFNYGDPFTKEVEDKIIESVKPSYVKGLTILGGEPMEITNQKVLAPFIKRLKEEVPGCSIWIYSGYTFEELTDDTNKRCHSDNTEEILKNVDVLVDGEFKEELKDLTLKFKGSSNQRIIDIQKSLKEGSVVLATL